MAAKYDVLTSSDGRYYFDLKAPNGKVVLTSEQYSTREEALEGVESARTNAAIPARFERRTSVAGEPYFVLRERNGEPVGRSEMYTSRWGRDNGIRSVEINAPAARVDDLTG